MKRVIPNTGGFLKSEVGQALTEFTIVIPVVLLFFFAMIQYFEVVKASQLANYAAYTAARVYAVREAVDGKDQAVKLANRAAALAMAPVARLVPGEIAGLGSLTLPSLPSDFPSGLQSATTLAEGFTVALGVRLNESIGGGSVKITTSGTPKQVDVEVNYPQPIYVPGLAELWAVVAGDKGIHHNLKPLRDGLGGLPGTVLPAIEVSESQLFAQFGLKDFSIPSNIMFPYVNVRGKCSMGYSDWGSKDPEFRPRQHSTVKDAEPDPADQQKLQNAKDAQKVAKDYQDKVKDETQKCKDWNAARDQLKAAQANHDAVFNNSKSTQAQKDQADAELQQAQTDEQNAHDAYEKARADRQATQQQLENLTGQHYDDLNCE